MSRSRRPKNRPVKNRAFTLIEILVVVAIIALLVSILMPSLAAAKRQARVVVCGTNLKTLGTATMFYAQASRDDMPTGYETMPNNRPVTTVNGETIHGSNPWEFLYPYALKQSNKKSSAQMAISGYQLSIPVYQCPEDKAPHWTSEKGMMTPDGLKDVDMPLSYGANLLAMYSDSISAVSDTGGASNAAKYRTHGAGKLSKIRNPSSIVSYYDSGNDGDAISEFIDSAQNPIGRVPNPKAGWITSDCMADLAAKNNQCTIELRHKTGNQFSFVDGHVNFYSMGYNGPYYGLPHFPTAWLPGYARATWPKPSDSNNPDAERVAWVWTWEAGAPIKSFKEPRPGP